MKKIFSILVFLFLCILNCGKANADLTIKNYYMDIKISEDNVYDVYENIDAYFDTSMHGIYRSIPTGGNIYREGEKVSRYRAVISDVQVNNPYTTSQSGNNYVLKIGSPNVYVRDNQNYKIRYNYKALDFSNKKDEVYYNLVGEAWEVPIEHFSFSVTLPKDFDHSKVYFYDKYGDTNKVRYSIKGNTITGSYNEKLQPGDPFTIYVPLPDGYFNSNFWDILVLYLKYLPFIFPFVMMFLALYLWSNHGKDEKTFEVVEFQPPNNLNPVEIAYLYKQNVSPEDVSTLLIYLANQGYIKIEEDESNWWEKDYKIIKQKEYIQGKYSEMKFFRALFSECNMVYSADIKNNTKLSESAVKIIDKTKDSLSKNLFEPESLAWQKTILWFMVATWVLMAVYVSIVTIPFIIVHLILFPIIGYSILSTGIKSKNAFYISFGSLWSFVTVFVLGMFIMSEDVSMLFPILLTLACIIIMDVVRFYMPKWTDKGNSLYGRVLGFRNFLEKVEVDRLQRLVDKDPKYFYNIIPYAYVLGLEKKWFSKFAKLVCPPPEFYSGNNFSIHSFNSINSLVHTVGTSCAVSTSGSGGHGGFGGGGGCGGGGHGGGGGGGW